MKIILIIILLSLLLTFPAMAYVGDNCDVFPIFYGTDNGGADNGYIVFRDQTGAWDAPVLVAADLLQGQCTPQRNAIGWRGPRQGIFAGGKWYVTFIEDTNDLEIWASGDDGWQDDAGVWTLVAEDTNYDWLAVDVESRQGFVHGMLAAQDVPLGFYGCYIDLRVAVPAWTTYAGGPINDSSFSIVMNQQAFPYDVVVWRDAVDQTINIGHGGYNGFRSVDSGATGDYPQIVCDGSDWNWAFYTVANALNVVTYPLVITAPFAYTTTVGFGTIYAATGLTQDYHATWLKMDDTIHVVLVDFNPAGNTLLVYIRHTPNELEAPMTVVTVDSSPEVFDALSWPQITVDTLGNIVIYYIFTDNWTGGFAGDLRCEYLDAGLYADYAIPASWASYNNVDQSGDDVKWCVAPDYIPIAGDF